MPRLSHSSYICGANDKDHQIRLSIDALSSVKNKDSDTVRYTALAFSTGGMADDKHQKKMMLTFSSKSRNNPAETKAFAVHNLNLNKLLRDSTVKFNHKMKYQFAVKSDPFKMKESFRLQFQDLQMGSLDSVSPLDKKRGVGEYFVFGSKLSKCQVFLDSRNETPSKRGNKHTRRRSSNSVGDSEPRDKKKSFDRRTRSYSLQEDSEDVDESPEINESHWCLHAFIHHFFCSLEGGGNMILDCLCGVHSNDDGYTLLTPTVHSLSESYGPKDRGEMGIRKIIKNHKCNCYCKHLPNMETRLDEVLNTAQQWTTGLPHDDFRELRLRV